MPDWWRHWCVDVYLEWHHILRTLVFTDRLTFLLGMAFIIGRGEVVNKIHTSFKIPNIEDWGSYPPWCPPLCRWADMLSVVSSVLTCFINAVGHELLSVVSLCGSLRQPELAANPFNLLKPQQGSTPFDVISARLAGFLDNKAERPGFVRLK